MDTADVDLTGANLDVDRCSECGKPVVPIAYGFPGPEMFEAAERCEIILGGCMIVADNPTHRCPCGTTKSGAFGSGGDLVAFSIDEARSLR